MESLPGRLLSNLSSPVPILVSIYNTSPLPFYSIKNFIPYILAQSVYNILLAPTTPIYTSIPVVLASPIPTECTIFKLAK
jgi:hypothetical protein